MYITFNLEKVLVSGFEILTLEHDQLQNFNISFKEICFQILYCSVTCAEK